MLSYTVVPEYIVRRDPSIVSLLPKDAVDMLDLSRYSGFKINIENQRWEWCFLDVQHDALYPQFITLCCRSRGAWDESQEVLYDTESKEYAMSIRRYNDAFSPDTIVKRCKYLNDVLSYLPSV
jgi:hypothetical protein